jgi:GH25 family lysozyme M1 (1,4-beta-N-acetylmuramidase)
MPSFRSPAVSAGKRQQATARLAGATALCMAVGLLMAPGASAQELQQPGPYFQQEPARDGDMPESPGSVELGLASPSHPDEAGDDPSGNQAQIDGGAVPAPSLQTLQPTETTEPSSPAGTTAERPARPSPEANETAEPAQKPESVEVPVEELSQEQLLELLKTLQGEHGAEMGQGLQQRREREQELEEPEVLAELDAKLEVLDIERSSVVAAAAVPMLNRNKWKPNGVQGMDVSSHQPKVNWKTEWNYGARFAYVKSTEALTYKNPEFPSQYAGSYNVGMIRGAYHFAIPNVSSGKAQANYMVNNGGGWSADGKTLPPLLDIEYNPYPELGNTCYGMSPKAMVAWITDFSNTIKARTGRLPAIYTTADWWNQCTGNSTTFKNHPLHVAHYTTGTPWLPSGWKSYAIWQYSSTGPYSGDSNVWHGSYSNLQNFAYNRTVTGDWTERYATPGDLNRDGNGDLISRRSDGSLWFYPGNGAGGYKPATRIGGGWQIYSLLIGTGDYNGDKLNDLLARQTDGTLWLYKGKGNGTFQARVRIGSSGWNGFTHIIGPGDLNRDGTNDLLARRPDGTVWLYEAPGNGQHGNRTQVAKGWGSYTKLVATRDFTGDGRVDVLASKADGTLWLNAGTGKTGTGTFATPRRIGSGGWAAFTDILGAWDNDRDKKNDVVAISPNGALTFYKGTQMVDSEGYNTRTLLSSNWKQFNTVVTPGDFTGDGRSDLVGRKADGTLWLMRGTGKGGYGAPERIGRGWQIYSSIVGIGDYNRDGKNDLVARQTNGTLWFYAGTGAVGGSSEGYKRRLKIGNSGWNQFKALVGTGDVNRDGKKDLLGVSREGIAWLYAGPGNGRHGSRTRIDTGWNYSQIVGVGDYDRNGTVDVVASKSDGTLWLRQGRMARTASGAWFNAERKIGNDGWQQYRQILGPGDTTSDNKVDMLATTNGGALWLYRGNAMTDDGYAKRRNVGKL